MASGGEYIAKLKENLTCPLCFELFDHGERIPKGLPCLHTFCLQCLDTYVQKNLEDHHLCPLCQAKFVVPCEGVNAVPTNTGMKNMLDLLPIQSECDLDQPLTKPACSQHGYKEYVVLCMDCKAGLCSFCIAGLKDGVHNNHGFEDVDKAMDSLKKDVDAKCEKLTECLEMCKKMANKTVTKSEEWKTSLKEIIGKRVSAIIENAKKWEAEINQEVDDMHDILVQDVTNKSTQELEKGKLLKDQFNDLSNMCKNYDFEAYKLMEDVTLQLDALSLDAHFSIKAPGEALTGFQIPPSFGSVTQETGNLTLVVNDVQAFGKQKLSNPIFSQHIYVQRLLWQIQIQLEHVDGKQKSLGVYLKCCINKTSPVSCKATYEFTLANHSTDKEPLVDISDEGKDINMFTPRYPAWGRRDFIEWSTLIDPAEGYVKDNSMSIEVTFTVDPPTGL